MIVGAESESVTFMMMMMQWFGQCPSCHTWGTLKLHQIPKETKKQGKTATVRRPDQETAARLNAGGGNKADISTLQSIENVAKGSPTKRRQLFSPEIVRSSVLCIFCCLYC